MQTKRQSVLCTRQRIKYFQHFLASWIRIIRWMCLDIFSAFQACKTTDRDNRKRNRIGRAQGSSFLISLRNLLFAMTLTVLLWSLTIFDKMAENIKTLSFVQKTLSSRTEWSNSCSHFNLSAPTTKKSSRGGTRTSPCSMADPVSIFTLIQTSVSLSIHFAEVVKILLEVVTRAGKIALEIST